MDIEEYFINLILYYHYENTKSSCKRDPRFKGQPYS